jgi:pectin methylesterase-like acyl-CoA thioesterase
LILIASSAYSIQATPIELIVAADGSAKYKTVQEAIMVVPAGNADSPVISRIKPEAYKELIYVQCEKRFFKLVGGDAEKTVLTFDLNANIIGKDGKAIGRSALFGRGYFGTNGVVCLISGLGNDRCGAGGIRAVLGFDELVGPCNKDAG